jgi:flagellar hook-associated protein 3 FlgL
MRISTSMIFDSGVNSINQQTAAALKLSQQISSGKRIITPADDPVGAAQALQVQQAKDINAQYTTNLGNAKSALGLEDTQLSTINDALTRIKELTVQAGNSILSSSNRQTIAVELRARFDQLLGIANATDGTGQYLFSGYKGSTLPFAGSVDGLIAAPTSDVSYLGDDGQRKLEISPANQVAISDSGTDVFLRIPAGNGFFTTTYAAGNTGTGVISTGTVTDPVAWNSYANKPLTVSFSLVGGVTNYTVTDSASATVATGVYVPNQAITPAGLGISFTLSGTPALTDTFTIQASSSRSLFRSLANLIGTLERPITGAATEAMYRVDIGSSMSDLEQASDNIQRVRTAVGSRGNQVTSQDNMNGDLDLQYAQTLAGLQDLDVTKAISDLTQTQTNLEAAQKSFAAVSKLSLFNYI